MVKKPFYLLQGEGRWNEDLVRANVYEEEAKQQNYFSFHPCTDTGFQFPFWDPRSLPIVTADSFSILHLHPLVKSSLPYIMLRQI